MTKAQQSTSYRETKAKNEPNFATVVNLFRALSGVESLLIFLLHTDQI